jgi:hypothetical protein
VRAGVGADRSAWELMHVRAEGPPRFGIDTSNVQGYVGAAIPGADDVYDRRSFGKRIVGSVLMIGSV